MLKVAAYERAMNAIQGDKKNAEKKANVFGNISFSMTNSSDGSARRESGTSTDKTSDDGEPSDLWLVGILSPLLLFVGMFIANISDFDILKTIFYTTYLTSILSLVVDVREM